MSKALKHSPEWNGPIKRYLDKAGKEISYTPYSRHTTLQIHTRGYTKQGKFVEGRYGKGDETLFVDLGLKAQEDPNAYAKLIHDSFMIAPKMADEITIQ